MTKIKFAFLLLICLSIFLFAENEQYNPVYSNNEPDQIAMLKGIGARVLGRLNELETIEKKENNIVELDGIKADIKVVENIVRALNENKLKEAEVYFPQCSPRVLKLKDEVVQEPSIYRPSLGMTSYSFRRPDSWGPRINNDNKTYEKKIDMAQFGKIDLNENSPDRTLDVMYPSPATVFCNVVHHKDNGTDWADPLGLTNDLVYRISIDGNQFVTGQISQNNNNFDSDLMLAYPTYSSNPSVVIEAWDTDGGWTGDDQIDISPTGSEINVSYSVSSKTWSGETSVPYAQQDANNACWFFLESGYDDEQGSKNVSWIRDVSNHRCGCIWGSTSSSSAPVIQNNGSMKWQDAFANPSSYRYIYYKFYAQSGDYFQIYLDDLEYDYDIYLYDPSGNLKDSGASGGTTADHVEYTSDVSGWWYISVYAFITTAPSGETGWFTLRFSDQLVNDYNFITVPISNERGYGISDYNGVSRYSDTYDYYKFYATNGSGRVRFVMTPSSGTDFDLYMYNPSGTQVDYSGATGTTPDTVEYDINTTGFWYIRVSRYSGYGYYTFSGQIVDLSDSYENDDNCNQYTSITPSTSNQTQTHTIFPSGDYDYYRFYAYCGRKYVFYSSGTFDTYGYLGYDGCTTIIENDDGGGNTNFRIEWCCISSGYYKVWVKGFSSSTTGDYTFNYYYSIDATCNSDIYESDDNCGYASTIAPGETQYRSINRDGADIDWIRFTTTYPADFTVLTDGTSGDTRLWLYRNGCTSYDSVAFDDDGGTDLFSMINATCMPAGTYYIKVDEYGNNDNICWYTLSLSYLTDRTITTPYLSSPSDYERTFGSSVTLSWSYVSGATGYRVYVNGSQIYDGTSTSVTYYPTRCQLYSWYVMAYNLCSSQSSTSRIFRHNGLPTVSLSSPNDAYHSTTGSVNLSFSGNDCDGDALQYQVYFGTSNPPPLYTTTSLPYLTVSTTDRCEPYYWRVRVYDGYEYSDYTETRAIYENMAPPTPTLTLPGDAGRNISNNVNLTWEPATDCNGDPVTYQVYFGTSSTPSLYTTTSSNSISIPTTDCTQYYWRIRAYDSYEYSSYSITRSFRENDEPGTPSLNTPTNGATVSITPTTVNWNITTDCDSDPLTYTYQVDTDNPPTAPYTASGTISGTTSTPFAVDHLTTYYWRVRANDSFEDGLWSSVWSFNVHLPTSSITIQTNVTGGSITADGTTRTSPYTVEWVVGSVHEIGCISPQMESGDSRYVFDHWSDSGSQNHNITVPSSNTTYTAFLTRQYRLTITNNPVGAGGGQVRVDGTNQTAPYTVWFNEGSSHTISAIDSMGTTDTRYLWQNWSDSGAKSHSITITSTSPRTYTANFNLQYYLTINVNGHGRATGEGWYNTGATANFGIDNFADESGGERWRFVSWNGAGTGSYTGTSNPATCTMNGPITETANWMHQYSLTIVNPGSYDTPNPAVGTHWYDENASVNATITSPVSVSDGIRAICTGWTGTGSVTLTGTETSTSFNISSPSTLNWVWKLQYRFTVQNPSGYDTPEPAIGEHWYDSGALVSGNVTSPADTFYCIGYDGTGSLPSGPGSTFSFNIGMPSSIRWNWAPAGAVIQLVVICPYDAPFPPAGTFYFLTGTRIDARVTSPANHLTDAGIRYRLTGWTGTGSVPSTGDSTHIGFVLNTNSTLTWNWTTQYKFTLTNTSGHGTPNPVVGIYWYDSGTNVAGNINLHDGDWVCIGYDGEGSIGDGFDTTFTFPITQPSSLEWLWMNGSDLLSLDIISLYGPTSPVAGRHYFVPGRSVNATAPASVSTVDGIRHICTGYSGTGSVPSSGTTNSVNFNITSNSTLTWNWRTELRLSISSAFDTPNPANGNYWYNEGANITASVNMNAGSMVCTGYMATGTISSGYDTTVTFTLTAPTSIIWMWTDISNALTLTVNSIRGNPSPSVGIHYYSTGSVLTLSVPDSIITLGDTRYIVSGYTGTGSVPAIGFTANVVITMNANSTINWNWKTQYQFSVTSEYGRPSPAVGIHWIDSSSVVNGTNWLTDRGPTGEVVCIGYNGEGSLGDAPDTSFSFVINMPSSVNWEWIQMDSAYLFVVHSDYAHPYPSRGRHYFRRNSIINATLDSTIIGNDSTRYTFIGWFGTGSVSDSGNTTSFSFTLDENSTLRWDWQTEYHITTDFTGCGGYIPTQTGTDWYPSGAGAIITSSQVVGIEGDRYAFKNWTSTPTGATIRNPFRYSTIVTVNAPYRFTANYDNALTIHLIKDSCHNFGDYYIDGDTVSATSCTLLTYFAYNTTHSIGVAERDTNNITGYGFKFKWWSDRGNRIHNVGPITRDTTFTAIYDPIYRAIVRKEPPETYGTFMIDRIIFTGAESDTQIYWWDANSPHNITTSSPDGRDTLRYRFNRWSDGGAIGHDLVITAPTEYIAYYYTEYLVRILKQPPENWGNISVNDSTFTRVGTKDFWAIKDSSYEIGVTRLDVSPDSVYIYDYWSDGGAITHRTPPIRTPMTYTAHYISMLGVLRICVSRLFWDADSVQLCQSKIMPQRDMITIQNCGTIPITLGLFTYDTTSTWSAGYINGDDVYTLRARFDDERTPPSTFDPRFDYIKSTVTWATERVFGPEGYNLEPPGGTDMTDNMWLQFVAPTGSSVYGRKTIHLIIDLSVYLP